MTAGLETTHRFLRPSDIGRIRRNQRRIHLGRILVIARNALFVAALVAGGVWAYRATQSDARFEVKRIEFAGAVHTPRAALEAVTRQYVGLNLFRIDIARVQRDLGSLAWIERIAIEKKLPDTMRINVVERTPAALLQTPAGLQYVDGAGVVVAELSPSLGDNDLPVVSGASGAELVRTMDLLKSLRQRDPVLYSRIAEVRPVAPRGFALFDREIGAFVYANAEDIDAKWRTLYSIVRSEQFARGGIEYADLRFADRVVVKPLNTPAAAIAASAPAKVTTQITN